MKMEQKKKRLQIVMLGLRGFPGVAGGVETHVHNLCEELEDFDCEIRIVMRSGHCPENRRLFANATAHELWAPRLPGVEAVVHTFLGVLYAAIKRPDLVHIHAVGPALMAPLARMLGLRVVVTHHGQDYEREKWSRFAKTIIHIGERMGMKYSDARIVISSPLKKLVSLKYGMNSELIPNGVNLPDMPGTEGILECLGLERGKYILLVSRFVPEKRHDDLIAAFKEAGLEGWKLVLVGALPESGAYQSRVLKLAGDRPDIVFTGFQTGVALKELYAHAGLFVLPSSHEGMPIVVLEALSYGIPVIASDIPAHMHVECDEICYFPVGNVTALARLLRNKTSNAGLRRSREELRGQIASQFNWTAVAEKTFAVYERVQALAGKSALRAQARQKMSMME
jgi:glycosyltransferase involved in cell wall biosynthesis